MCWTRKRDPRRIPDYKNKINHKFRPLQTLIFGTIFRRMSCRVP